MKATYVSVWDSDITIRTSCDYDPQTNDVTNIDQCNAIGLSILEREYIELPDGTEVERENFTIEGE